MCFEFDFLAVVDGGSLDHGAANRGYGSYQVQQNGRLRRTCRLTCCR